MHGCEWESEPRKGLWKMLQANQISAVSGEASLVPVLGRGSVALRDRSEALILAPSMFELPVDETAGADVSTEVVVG